MAKPKKAPAVSSSADIYEWTAEVLRLRFDEVMGFGEAVLAPGNVDAVHDMRVAIRRLRTALRDFVQVINEKPLKGVRTDLKKIADSLGAVRDHDVAIIALEEFAAEAEDVWLREGVEDLIGELRSKRKRALSGLKKKLASISLDKLRERFSARIDDSLRQLELFGPTNLKDVSRAVIEGRLQELCKTGKAIYEPFNAEKLHNLRIAAKRLRYSIELFAVCWSDEILEFAVELAKLQSDLGGVHDCDVWTVTLKKRFKEKGKSKTPAATSAWLLSKFVGKRSKAYRSALELWREWEANGFIKRLGAVIR